MARVDDASALAARRILDPEDLPVTEGDPEDQRVNTLLEHFYLLAQLTPAAQMPEDLAGRLEDRLSESEPVANSGEIERDRRRPLVLGKIMSWQIRVPVTALVMLVAALLLSVGANILLSRARQFRPEVSIHLNGTGSAPDALGVVLFDGDEIVMHANGLAELASGYRYVAWHSSGIGSQHLGTLTMLTPTTARLVTTVSELLPVVVVTIEPSASPSSPTGPQILVGSLIQ